MDERELNSGHRAQEAGTIPLEPVVDLEGRNRRTPPPPPKLRAADRPASICAPPCQTKRASGHTIYLLIIHSEIFLQLTALVARFI